MHEANIALLDILLDNSVIIPSFSNWTSTFYIYGALAKTAFCRILKRWFITRITCQNVQKFQILLFLPHT